MNKTKKPSGATLGSDDLRVITNGRPNPKPRLAGQQPETLIEESPAVFRRRDDGFFVVTRPLMCRMIFRPEQESDARMFFQVLLRHQAEWQR